MRKIKLMAVIMSCIVIAGLFSANPVYAAEKFSASNKQGSGLEIVKSGRSFEHYCVNGELTSKHPIIDNRITMVPAAVTLDGLSISYDMDKRTHNLTVYASDNTYTFKYGDNYYLKNGEIKVYNKITVLDGEKKAEDVRINYTAGELYIPLSFFTMELGYSDVFTVDKNWSLNLGKGSDILNKFTDYNKEDFITGAKLNKNKTVQEGWKCPVTNSISVDDTYLDSRTLIRELEFDENGSTSATYNVNGACCISVGPFAWGEGASHFTGIFYPAHNSSFSDVRYKMNQMIPQVFKFYFPNDYQKAIEIMENTYVTKQGVRYIIDGRDVVFAGDNIFMSKVNGSLKAHLAKYPVKGTIGTAYR